MESIWNLNALLIFTGLCFEVTAVLLLLNLSRVDSPARLTRSAVILLWIAISLQIIGLIVPEVRIASFLFVLGALPLLLPAPLISQAQQDKTAMQPATATMSRVSPPARAKPGPTMPMQTEFHGQLTRIESLLVRHREGLTLVEIGRELSVEWRRLTGAVNELLRQKRIRKEGKRYFHLSSR